MLDGIVNVHFPFFSFFYFFFFFCHDFVRAISLEPLPAETPNWVCCMVLRSSCALLLTIQFALLFFFFQFFLFFCQIECAILSGLPYLWNHYSQRLQTECAAWSCGSNFALLLTIQFALFVLATIFSGVEFFIFGGSLLGRIQGDQEPVSFLQISSELFYHSEMALVSVHGI